MIDMSRSEVERLIDSWILNERNRRILKRRLLDGTRYSSLSQEFDLTERRIKGIVSDGEKILYKHLLKEREKR